MDTYIDTEEDFSNFVGGRVLGSVIPAQTLAQNPVQAPPENPPPLTFVPDQPPPSQTQTQTQTQSKSAVSLLNEYVQRSGHGTSSNVLQYTFSVRESRFYAAVHVLGRDFEDTDSYTRKQEAKESVSRIAFAALSGLDITAVAGGPSSASTVDISSTDRKFIAWLNKHSIPSDGGLQKRPVALLHELCQILKVEPSFNPFYDDERLHVVELFVGGLTFRSPPSYHLNECKDTVARLAIEQLIIDHRNEHMPDAPVVVIAPPLVQPLAPPVPSLYTPDGTRKSYIALVYELCTLRRWSDPSFAFDSNRSGFSCDLRIGGQHFPGPMRFVKKVDAKENTARLAFEQMIG